MVKDTKSTQALTAAQAALEEAIENQQRSDAKHKQSISEVVHDIKNPLGAMMGYISLIRNEIAGPLNNETYSNYIKTLDTSAKRLLGLCESLLGEYSNVPVTDKVIKEVDAGAMVGEIKELFAAQAQERGINLEANVDDQFPNLMADPQDIYRALSNLMSNAIKFTPRGGKVQVQAEFDSKNNTFIMVVRDSGIGMTKEQIEKARTSQLTTISPHGDVGTGQGLGVVNRVLEQIGGKLEISSTENRGTRIKMCFPKSVSIKKSKQIITG